MYHKTCISHNHRIIGLGTISRDHLVTNPLLMLVPNSMLHRKVMRQVLNIARDGLSQEVPCISITGEPRTGQSTPDVASSGQIRGGG